MKTAPDLELDLDFIHEAYLLGGFWGGASVRPNFSWFCNTNSTSSGFSQRDLASLIKTSISYPTQKKSSIKLTLHQTTSFAYTNYKYYLLASCWIRKMIIRTGRIAKYTKRRRLQTPILDAGSNCITFKEQTLKIQLLMKYN